MKICKGLTKTGTKCKRIAFFEGRCIDHYFKELGIPRKVTKKSRRFLDE